MHTRTVVSVVVFVSLLLTLGGCSRDEKPSEPANTLQAPQLFVELPAFVATPDGMAFSPVGELALACPNFADA